MSSSVQNENLEVPKLEGKKRKRIHDCSVRSNPGYIGHKILYAII